jgi:tetratricopeptide (TPR) repeat protein
VGRPKEIALRRGAGRYNAVPMSHRLSWLGWFALGAVLAVLVCLVLYQLPPIKDRMEWRLDAAGGIVRGWLHPGDILPTPVGTPFAGLPALASRTPSPPPSTDQAPRTPTPTLPPLPASVALDPPEWEKQDWNNCGPATLALGLRYFGWEGDQYNISDLLKPDRGDKNVNVEELVYYVRNRAGWLGMDFRVGGTLEQVKRFLAAGYPVIVEKGFVLDENDGGGGWAGHYLLLTGYDDGKGVFITQDTNKGPDRIVTYAELDEGWKAFNRVFLYLYPVEQYPAIEALLGADADPDANRQHALDHAQDEIAVNGKDAYAWFNLGTNLVYFERFGEAAQAFDTALSLGLPWRFTRYQFGPYIAYFNQGRFDDLVALADATLYRTEKAEESHLWRGWGRYRLGDVAGARQDFLAALEVNPMYQDALYALDYIGG